jgi:hypothetical protein
VLSVVSGRRIWICILQFVCHNRRVCCFVTFSLNLPPFSVQQKVFGNESTLKHVLRILSCIICIKQHSLQYADFNVSC